MLFLFLLISFLFALQYSLSVVGINLGFLSAFLFFGSFRLSPKHLIFSILIASILEEFFSPHPAGLVFAISILFSLVLRLILKFIRDINFLFLILLAFFAQATLVFLEVLAMKLFVDGAGDFLKYQIQKQSLISFVFDVLLFILTFYVFSSISKAKNYLTGRTRRNTFGQV